MTHGPICLRHFRGHRCWARDCLRLADKTYWWWSAEHGEVLSGACLKHAGPRKRRRLGYYECVGELSGGRRRYRRLKARIAAAAVARRSA